MELIEHKRFAELSTWHEGCSRQRSASVWQNRRDEEDPRCFPRCGGRAPQCGGLAAERDSKTGAAVGSQPGAVPGTDGPAGCAAETDGSPDSGAVQRFAAERMDARKHGATADLAGDDPGVSPAVGAAAERVLERKSGGFADFGDTAFQPGNRRKLERSLSGTAVRDDHYGPGGFSAAVLDRAAGRAEGNLRDGARDGAGASDGEDGRKCVSRLRNDSAAGVLFGREG